MSRSQIPKRKSRMFREIPGEVKRKIRRHQVVSTLITWIVASILDGIAESMVDLNKFLDKPFEELGRWHPQDHFLGWIEFTLFLLLYLGAALLTWNFIRRIAGQKRPSMIYPKILYEEELAAAAHAVDYPDMVGKELVTERVEDLMYSIAETVATAIGVPPKYYRAYFVVGFDGGTAISGFRIGRQFRLTGSSNQAIDHILLADTGPMERMYQRTKTVSVMREVQDEFPESDIHQMVMVRNPGKFRLCFLMAILNGHANIDEHDETFLQVSYIIRSLGFMDNLVEYVLQYGGKEEEQR